VEASKKVKRKKARHDSRTSVSALLSKKVDRRKRSIERGHEKLSKRNDDDKG